MTLKAKPILIGLVIAALIAGGLYYFLREEPLEDTRRESVVTRMAFSGSHLTETQDGKPIWDLTARVMEVDSKTQWVYLTDMTGVIYEQPIGMVFFQKLFSFFPSQYKACSGKPVCVRAIVTYHSYRGKSASGWIACRRIQYVMIADPVFYKIFLVISGSGEKFRAL